MDLFKRNILKKCAHLGLILLLFPAFSFIPYFGVHPDAFIDYYVDNQEHYSRSGKSGVIEYEVKFIPNELRIIKSYHSQKIDAKEAQIALNKAKSSFEFILKMNIPKNGNQEFLKHPHESLSYDARVEYYAFGFVKDIHVQFDQGPIENIQEYIFERNFGVDPSGSACLFIQAPKNANNIKIIIDDRVYGVGRVELDFDNKKLNNLPRLKKVSKWKKSIK